MSEGMQGGTTLGMAASHRFAQSISRSRRTAGASGFFVLSHWSVRCDHGVVITRVPDSHVTEVYVAKVRFQETGEQGTVKLRFDRLSGRFELLNDAGAVQMVA